MTREEQIIKASHLYAKAQQKPFMDGAKWADKTMIDKACKWLEERQLIDLEVPNIDKFISEFRKAMEE